MSLNMGFLSPKRSFAVFMLGPRKHSQKNDAAQHGKVSMENAGWKSRSTKFLQTQEQQTNKGVNQLRTVQVGSFPET